MRFCIACGHKQEHKEQVFCVSCGSSLSESEGKQNAVASSSVEPVKAKKEMPKKQKGKFIIGAVVLVVLIALYFIGNHFTSEARLINKYTDAIREKDAVKIGEMVSFAHVDKKIGEDHAEAFLSLLDHHPQKKQEVLEGLNKQANLSQHGSANEWMTDDYIVSLVKGNGFLFYDTYELVMTPIYINLHTNVEDAILFVGDEEVVTSDATDFSHEYGPMTMGFYTFRATIDNKYVDLETTKDVAITNWSGIEPIDLSMDVTYIGFDVADLGKLDARLIIDGKMTAFNFLEADEFGPILADETEVSAEVDFPWGTMRSEPDYPYQSYPLNFSLSEDMQTEISQEIINFHERYWEGWQKNNTSEFDDLPRKLKDKIKSEYSYYHSDDYYIFERQHVSAEIDKQHIEMNYDNGDYLLIVNVVEAYLEGSYHDANDKLLSERTAYYQIEFRYDDGWKVNDFHQTYHDVIDDPLNLELSDELYKVNGKKEYEEAEKNDVKDKEKVDSNHEEKAEKAVLNYIEYLVEGINVGDYDLVAAYIKDGSALHGMQKDLIDRLFKNGTTQEVVTASVEKVSEHGDGWIVTTNETIKIIYESGKEDIKSYVWNYTVETDGNNFVLTNIEGVE